MGDQDKKWSELRKGTSSFLHRVLRWLSYSVLASSALAIIVILALRLVPTSLGWTFMAFSFMALASSILGCTNSWSSWTCCYGLYTFLLIACAAVQGSVFLLLVSRPASVLSHLGTQRSFSDARLLLKVEAATLLWTCSVDVLILSLSCLMHRCGHGSTCHASNGYVDLEEGAVDPDSKASATNPGFFSRAL